MEDLHEVGDLGKWGGVERWGKGGEAVIKVDGLGYVLYKYI